MSVRSLSLGLLSWLGALANADNIIQGWALVEDQCPQGTGGCGARSCCPLEAYCDTFDSGNSNFCCPTSDACGYNVTHGGSRCAVDSWVLWTTNKDPICCLPGETGTNAAESESYGHCIAAGVGIPSASMGTLIGSAGATAGATLPSGFTTAGPTTSFAYLASSTTSSASIAPATSTSGASSTTRSSTTSGRQTTSAGSSSSTAAASQAVETAGAAAAACAGTVGYVLAGLVFVAVRM